MRTAPKSPLTTTLATAEKRYPLEHPMPGHAEQRAQDWWAALASAVLALTGCAVEAPVPYGANYAQPTQMKVRAAGQDRRFSDWKARRVEMIVAPIAVAETVN